MDDKIIACAALGKDVLVQVLGPTAKYWGEGLKNLNEKIVKNLGEICRKALEKLSYNPSQGGTVPPRIASQIFQHGGMCEDELLIDYYGGLLAASKIASNRDDRVLTLLSSLIFMSTYQIRSHYIFYKIFRSVFLGKSVNIQVTAEANKLAVFIPIEIYNKAMAFLPEEDVNTILPHSLNALFRNNQISPTYWFGNQEFLLEQFPNNSQITSSGIIVAPSPIGAELYLASQGLKIFNVNDLFDPKCPSGTFPGIHIKEGSVPLFASSLEITNAEQSEAQ